MDLLQCFTINTYNKTIGKIYYIYNIYKICCIWYLPVLLLRDGPLILSCIVLIIHPHYSEVVNCDVVTDFCFDLHFCCHTCDANPHVFIVVYDMWVWGYLITRY